MINLSKFRPAETLLILDGSDAQVRDLLKITFMDLVLKQALEIVTIARDPGNSRDEVRYYKYITRGKNFSSHRAREYELVYLSPYSQSMSIRILLRHLIRVGFQNAINRKKYVSSVRDSYTIRQYFDTNLIQKIFGGFSITENGLDLRERLRSEIAELEIELPDILNSDKEKALEILNAIGGNIFLLKNIDFTLLKEIDQDILIEMKRRRRSEGDGSGDNGCSYWSGCAGCGGSDDSSGCSGCGGDGCSGCGGCGGD